MAAFVGSTNYTSMISVLPGGAAPQTGLQVRQHVETELEVLLLARSKGVRSLKSSLVSRSLDVIGSCVAKPIRSLPISYSAGIGPRRS